MTLAASIIFFLSLAAIASLFTLKFWELAHERVLFPRMRAEADGRALRLKELLDAGLKDLGKIPPILLYASREIVRGIALDIGRISAWLSQEAHRLADSVSHKRNFTKGQPRSEFLKKVNEHKNGNGNGGSDASNV